MQTDPQYMPRNCRKYISTKPERKCRISKMKHGFALQSLKLSKHGKQAIPEEILASDDRKLASYACKIFTARHAISGPRVINKGPKEIASWILSRICHQAYLFILDIIKHNPCLVETNGDQNKVSETNQHHT